MQFQCSSSSTEVWAGIQALAEMYQRECLNMTDVNRNTVHQNGWMHYLCIGTQPADRNRGGSRGEQGWVDEVLVEIAQSDWERVAGEGQNAQMQDCYVLYHENGTTLVINHWWTGDDG